MVNSLRSLIMLQASVPNCQILSISVTVSLFMNLRRSSRANRFSHNALSTFCESLKVKTEEAQVATWQGRPIGKPLLTTFVLRKEKSTNWGCSTWSPSSIRIYLIRIQYTNTRWQWDPPHSIVLEVYINSPFHRLHYRPLTISHSIQILHQPNVQSRGKSHLCSRTPSIFFSLANSIWWVKLWLYTLSLWQIICTEIV